MCCLDVLVGPHVLLWMLRGIFFLWGGLSDGSSCPEGFSCCCTFFGVVELGVTRRGRVRFGVIGTALGRHAVHTLYVLFFLLSSPYYVPGGCFLLQYFISGLVSRELRGVDEGCVYLLYSPGLVSMCYVLCCLDVLVDHPCFVVDVAWYLLLSGQHVRWVELPGCSFLL